MTARKRRRKGETLDEGLAEVGRTYNIPHGGCAEDEDADVIGPLSIVKICAIALGTCAVPDAVDLVDEADLDDPVPRPFGGINVGLITCVFACKDSPMSAEICLMPS